MSVSRLEAQPHVFDLEPDGLRELVECWGLRPFRAAQVLEWVYRAGVSDFEAMTNIAKADRALLAQRLTLFRGRVLTHQRASDGTQKVLLGWDHVTPAGRGMDRGSGRGSGRGMCRGAKRALTPGASDAARPDASQAGVALPLLTDATDLSGHASGAAGMSTECVMIPAESRESGRPRRTACVSSQVGCPVGCRFCASGLGGLDGNLTAGQIVEQVARWNRVLAEQAPGAARHGGRQAGPPDDDRPGITNVVFMGMGEPLANFNAVTRALRIMTASWGLNLSARRVTVSTVGLPAQMRRLAEVDLPITLAISLHAPNDALRQRIIPWAEAVSVEQLVDAGRYYFQRSGREVTLEYTLLGGLNDRPEHAAELARVARRLRSNINLIRYNEVAALPYRRPEDGDVHRFQSLLRGEGLSVHIRASRGRDIAAACGQLRYEQSQAAAPASR